MERFPLLLDPRMVSTGYLVVRQGRHCGKRRLLKPITLLGSARGCDIRIQGEGILPLLGVIAVTAQGLMLRSFLPELTRVNGTPRTGQVLRNGDELEIGPLHFSVEWQQVPAAVPLADAAEESDSTGMSSPLKPERIEALLAQLAEARVAIRQQRAEQKAQFEQEARALAEAREQIENRERLVEADSTRLRQLRQRLIKRWHTHWSSERERLSEQQRQLDELRNDLHNERTRLTDRAVRWSEDEAALRRKFEVEREQFEAERSRWQADRREQEERLQIREAELAQRESRVVEQEEQIQRNRSLAEERCARLRVEAEGLESRIVNSRAVLLALERERQTKQPSISSSPAYVLPGSAYPTSERGESEQRELASMVYLAESLHDQRQVLLEQFETFRRLQIEHWQTQEQMAEELHRRVEACESWEAQLRERLTEVERLEQQLEDARLQGERQAEDLAHRERRLEIRELMFRAERERADQELSGRLNRVLRAEQALPELFRRIRERRAKEVAELRQQHERCLALQHRWLGMLAGEESRALELAHRQLALASQARFLEEARQKLQKETKRPLLAQKRLERLERRLVRARERFDSLVVQQRQMLETEIVRQEAALSRLLKQFEVTHAQEQSLANRMDAWEAEQHLVSQHKQTWEQERLIWEQQREAYEDQIQRLVARANETLARPRLDSPTIMTMARAA